MSRRKTRQTLCNPERREHRATLRCIVGASRVARTTVWARFPSTPCYRLPSNVRSVSTFSRPPANFRGVSADSKGSGEAVAGTLSPLRLYAPASSWHGLSQSPNNQSPAFAISAAPVNPSAFASRITTSREAISRPAQSRQRKSY